LRWRTRAAGGDAEEYDGTNDEAVRVLAGDSWVGMRPVVRNLDGGEVTLEPGFVLSRADGARGVVVSTPGSWDELTETA
jgi:hypothetical protein